MLFLEGVPQVGVDLEVRLLRIKRGVFLVVQVPASLPDPLLLFHRNLFFVVLFFEAEGPVDKLFQDAPVEDKGKNFKKLTNYLKYISHKVRAKLLEARGGFNRHLEFKARVKAGVK